jgi:hypothetical protein
MEPQTDMDQQEIDSETSRSGEQIRDTAEGE